MAKLAVTGAAAAIAVAHGCTADIVVATATIAVAHRALPTADLAGCAELGDEQQIGLVERVVALCSVAIQPEIRVVVQRGAEDRVAVARVGASVENVLMPDIVDKMARHETPIAIFDAELQVAAIGLDGVSSHLSTKAGAFRHSQHQLAHDVAKIDTIDSVPLSLDFRRRRHHRHCCQQRRTYSDLGIHNVLPLPLRQPPWQLSLEI